MYEDITCAEYNDGVLVVDCIQHISGDEAIDMAASDFISNIVDSMEFENYQPQKE